MLAWGETPGRSFAFIHLLLNLKARYGQPSRVSTEILPALAHIRTDLDQFSPVECEALMYHGYTLIDSQLNQYCCDFLKRHLNGKQSPPLRTPPLFKSKVQQSLRQMTKGKDKNNWDPIPARSWKPAARASMCFAL